MKVHFIGIGGIGVSAIARMMLAAGQTVTGSDQSESLVTEELAKLGATIFGHHHADNVSADVDLVVYTIALAVDNPELIKAKSLDVPVLSYPEMLGRISADKYTIAVAGTHGKTTTTAMLAQIFIAAGLDPTVIVGSLFKDSQSNFIAGKSKYLIVEACEYRRSFLNLNPKILVITNIDNDHLDYYKNLADIQSAFAELAAKVPADGRVITETEYRQVPLPIELPMPGEHNQRNAQAAIAAAKAVGIDEGLARRALAKFSGTWRRFEYKGETKTGAKVYDDYAHHPTEIAATLAGARAVFPDKKITIVFQPHLYSRTKLLFDDFTKSFSGADEVIILPIYAAREPADPSITSERLAKAIGGRYLPSLAEAATYLTAHTGPTDLVVIMGAGDISRLADSLLQ